MGDENALNQDPSVQGQQAGAESQKTIDQIQKEMQAGVDKRIGELLSRQRELQDNFNRVMEQNTELLAQNAQLAARAVPQVQEPQFEIDPEEAKKLDYVVGRATAPLKAEIQRLQASQRQAIISSQSADVQAKLAKLNDPAVTARVQELVRAWTHPDSPYRNATPGDALRIAMGEKALGMLGQQDDNRQELERFNANAQPLTAHGGGRTAPNAAPAPSQRQSATERLDNADLSNLSMQDLDKLIQDAEKENPNGIPI